MILLWINNIYENTPDTLILWNIPVPPVPIRPSVPMDSGMSDYTHVYSYVFIICIYV